MNYQLKSSIKGRGPRRDMGPVARLVVGIILAFFFVMLLIAPERLASWCAAILTPFWNFGTAIETSFISPASLLEENTLLTQRLITLESADLRIATLEQENAELKHILGRNDVIDTIASTLATSSPIKLLENSTLAAVIRKPPYSAYDSLIIDIGSMEGVVNGDHVFALGNVMIGKVVDVYAHTSKVELYSNPGNTYDVLIGKDNIIAKATARGGGVFEVILPRDAAIVVGDIVTVPGIISVSFATVTAIVAEPARAFSTVLLSSPINIATLRWVVVEHAR